MSKHYYKATIQYSGTNYTGFQFQLEKPTVQSEINRALSELIREKVTTVAASRTDTGVHAREQIVKITTIKSLDLAGFVTALNNLLPNDIRCLEIKDCPGNFHPSSEALHKEYRYLFTNKAQVTKEETKWIANIANPLNLADMQSCLQAIIGEHDFCNFYSSGSNVKTTVRTIMECELLIINPQTIFREQDLFSFEQNSCYQLRIKAKGFLKQMIRHLMSALWMVGSGKLSVEDFKNLLNGPKINKQKWKVASPNGLFLFKITY